MYGTGSATILARPVVSQENVSPRSVPAQTVLSKSNQKALLLTYSTFRTHPISSESGVPVEACSRL